MPPLRTALVTQVATTALVFGGALLAWPAALQQPVSLALLQGLLAAFIAFRVQAPPWWLVIHLVFMPLVILASRLDVAPTWYLGAFLLLLAIYWRTDRSQVPLYLSNRTTTEAVASLLPAGPCRVLDLGCGDGSLLRRLARHRPDAQFIGIEHAPLPWAWARLAALGMANCEIRRGDFWQEPLAGFDLVYAFLSPAPMPRLWTKAQGEMARQSLLVSNSFVVPGVAAEQTLLLTDRRATQLFCYRPGNR
jgi:SAM-dependent methyltransferase